MPNVWLSRFTFFVRTRLLVSAANGPNPKFSIKFDVLNCIHWNPHISGASLVCSDRDYGGRCRNHATALLRLDRNWDSGFRNVRSC